ncbi:chromatin-remodeling complex subunit ies6 [Ceratobasidium sp. 414]|nr:chromatin-remodeling complex subunit ies6 [Ceratobasidium sp. 414]
MTALSAETRNWESYLTSITRRNAENENLPHPPQSSLQRLNHQYVNANPHNLSYLTAAKSLVESLSYAHYPRPFKNPVYTKNTNRRAKSAKQVLGAEREREKLGREKAKPQGTDVEWVEDPDAMTFTSIEAPPSVLPQKRYCDITGLEGPYTDPASGLRYHDKSIYELIKSLPSLESGVNAGLSVCSQPALRRKVILAGYPHLVSGQLFCRYDVGSASIFIFISNNEIGEREKKLQETQYQYTNKYIYT